MERKPEREWKTLRTLASQDAMLEEEGVSVSRPDPVSEDPDPEAPEEALSEKTSQIRVSIASGKEAPETKISENRDWVVPEVGDTVVETSEVEEPGGVSSEEKESGDEVAVFEEIERPDRFLATAISMGPDPTQIPDPTLTSGQGLPDAGNRILVAHGVASTSRLIRETLENFTDAEVETTSDPVRAFELALQKPYRRFFFAMQVGELTGVMLYELISKAYANGSAKKTLAPGVVFIREKEDPRLPPELARDARVKDTISKPIRIERLLKTVEDILEVQDPTVK